MRTAVLAFAFAAPLAAADPPTPMEFTGRVKAAPAQAPLAAAAGGLAAAAGTATIEFEVDERSFLTLQRTGKAAVAFALIDEDGFPRPAELSGTDCAVDANTGTIKVRARASNPGGVMLPGMFVRVRLTPAK